MRRIAVARANELALSRNIVPLEPFPGNGYSPWLVRCSLCAEAISTTYNKLNLAKEIGCASCSRATQAKLRGYKLTKAKLQKNDWNLLTPILDYEDSQSLAEVECSICSLRKAYYPHLLIKKKCECKINDELQAKYVFGQSVAREKGGELLSKSYSGARAKHRWRCAERHEWDAQFSSVTTKSNTWCPYCSGRVAISGIDDLQTIDPMLASEFDSARNHPLAVEQLKPNSNKKVWWSCGLGHSFEATPSSRYGQGTGCPFCSGRRVLAGFNDLETLDPDVARLWHPTKNGTLKPSQVTRTSNRKIWWKCEFGHETNNVLGTKIYTRGGCSTCSGKLLARGINDLATTRPDLAADWHPELNAGLSPSDVTAHSNKVVWWQCKLGHSWKKDCGGRAQGRGCPYCAFKKCWPGFNDLATTHPYLAEEWDWDRNQITPDSIIAGSRTLAYWICPFGHGSYPLSTLARAFAAEQDCPECSQGGYKSVHRGILYFIQNDSLHARKIGITNSHKTLRRLEAFEKSGWTRIKVWEHDNGAVAKGMETALLKGWIRREFDMRGYLNKNEMSGLSGHTETFSFEGPTNSEIIAKGDLLFLNLALAVERDPYLLEQLSPSS